MGFNTTDDQSYAELVKQSLIALSNPLALLRPSLLNLTSNCWATGDILQRVLSPGKEDQFSGLQSLSGDLKTSMPSDLVNVSALSVFEYLEVLRLLPSFTSVLNDTFQSCSQSARFGIPMEDLDFSRNCLETGRFWQREIYLNKTSSVQTVASLFKNALPPPFPDMTDTIMNSIAITTMNVTTTAINGSLQEPFKTLMTDAAKSCAPAACALLNYSGNADIAGEGVGHSLHIEDGWTESIE